MNKLRVSVTINGAAFTTVVDTRTLLLDFIRDAAELTGAKRGCNEGKCGACTVLVDGRAIKSCNMLAASADGAAIETVEGLASNGKLHPIQEAFHRNHGLQCGFCTAGFLMTAKFLLDNGIEPDESLIRDAVHGNICRCTGYQKIIESVMDAIKTRVHGKAKVIAEVRTS
ncbi:(2Fe-2S)-binding protein [Pseudolabrys sp.]|uniref:(2Fe-2S)-binding protein n=1 Tax=Pseudolabrys sp. TaxID=1960880 RepID=UPI003D0D1278